MPSKRRTDGDGTVFKRTDGMWVGQHTIGWTTTGRRKYKTVTATTKTEATRRLRASMNQLHGGTDTLDAWLDYWLRNIAPKRVRRSTLDSYAGVVKHINEAIGRVRLTDLKPEDVERMHRKLSKTLAPGTVLKAHRVLSRALKVAMQRQKISVNPATLVDAPSIPHFEVTPLTPEQARAVLQVARQWRNAPRWTVALALGLRQGEALGLRWQDVDLDAGTITVRHTLTQYQTLSEPKTKRSARVILMPNMLREQMKEHRVEQAKERLRMGDEWVGDPLGEFVFTRPDGRHLSAVTDNKHWKRLLAEAGAPEVRLHDARHTAATLLLTQGVPPRVVMEVMGHSTIQMTTRYQHVIPELAEVAASAMDRAFDGGEKSRRVTNS